MTAFKNCMWLWLSDLFMETKVATKRKFTSNNFSGCKVLIIIILFFRKQHLLKTVHYVPGSSRWVTDQCIAVTLMVMIVPNMRVRYVHCTVHTVLSFNQGCSFSTCVHETPNTFPLLLRYRVFLFSGYKPTAAIGIFLSKCFRCLEFKF